MLGRVRGKMLHVHCALFSLCLTLKFGFRLNGSPLFSSNEKICFKKLLCPLSVVDSFLDMILEVLMILFRSAQVPLFQPVSPVNPSVMYLDSWILFLQLIFFAEHLVRLDLGSTWVAPYLL